MYKDGSYIYTVVGDFPNDEYDYWDKLITIMFFMDNITPFLWLSLLYFLHLFKIFSTCTLSCIIFYNICFCCFLIPDFPYTSLVAISVCILGRCFHNKDFCWVGRSSWPLWAWPFLSAFKLFEGRVFPEGYSRAGVILWILAEIKFLLNINLLFILVLVLWCA